MLSGAVEGTRGNAGVVRIGLSVTGKINPIITCCQSYVAYVPFKVARVCYPEPWKSGMRPRNLVCITLLALCHLQVKGQALTNALPPAEAAQGAGNLGGADAEKAEAQTTAAELPDDPEQEMMPVAQPG